LFRGKAPQVADIPGREDRKERSKKEAEKDTRQISPTEIKENKTEIEANKPRNKEGGK
jgi:hypothetical protein